MPPRSPRFSTRVGTRRWHPSPPTPRAAASGASTRASCASSRCRPRHLQAGRSWRVAVRAPPPTTTSSPTCSTSMPPIAVHSTVPPPPPPPPPPPRRPSPSALVRLCPPPLFLVAEPPPFPNPEPRRYRNLARLVVGARVLLVTATPIHNRPADLFHLFRLFLRDHALAGLGL